MRKINILIGAFAIMTVLLGNFTCVNSMTEEEYIYYRDMAQKDAINNLEYIGILRNASEKWDSDSYITRRNALEIAYIFNLFSREFVLDTEGRTDEEVANEINGMQNTWDTMGFLYGENARQFNFADIEKGTYDYDLAANLCYCNIMVGEEVDGKKYAHFDEYMTYEQAFSTISRLFSVWTEVHTNSETRIKKHYMWDYPDVKYPYYQFCIDTGMINKKETPFYKYSLNVEEEQLTEYMRAYDYFYLINEALYIHANQAMYGYAVPDIYSCRRIDYWYGKGYEFMEKMKENMDKWDIVN